MSKFWVQEQNSHPDHDNWIDRLGCSDVKQCIDYATGCAKHGNIVRVIERTDHVIYKPAHEA